MPANKPIVPAIRGTTDLILTVADPVAQVKAPEALNLVFAHFDIDAVVVPQGDDRNENRQNQGKEHQPLAGAQRGERDNAGSDVGARKSSAVKHPVTLIEERKRAERPGPEQRCLASGVDKPRAKNGE